MVDLETLRNNLKVALLSAQHVSIKINIYAYNERE